MPIEHIVLSFWENVISALRADRALWEASKKAFVTGDFGLVGSQTVPRLAD
jgi:hypothetical protein